MLKIYNTLNRQVEEFVPQNPPVVTYYSCGPTVYDYAHIGNLRSYMFADILKRVLRFDGYEVKHVMNITDVGHLVGDGDDGEDKVERMAKKQKKTAWEVVDFYTEAWQQDMKKMNIEPADILAKATVHVPEQIELARKLEEKGFLYRISDGMYFDTSKVADYGKLARLNLAGQEEGVSVEANAEKRNPADFAVWKFSAPGENRQMEWESPWGIGFPGWHLECSAMCMRYLGETVDLHTGGIDAIPVHHTNEIAQSEAATGKPFVKYWVHNDFLLINEGRMGKSLGNAYTMSDLESRGYEPLVFRFFLLSASYRSKLNFTFDVMDNAKHNWEILKNKFLSLGQVDGQVDAAFLKEFTDEINDDLNTPKALALVWKLFKAELPDADKRATLLKFDEVLGLNLIALKPAEHEEIPSDISALVEERAKARADKRWDKSDEIRKLINKMGYEVEDSASGAVVRKQRG